MHLSTPAKQEGSGRNCLETSKTGLYRKAVVALKISVSTMASIIHEWEKLEPPGLFLELAGWRPRPISSMAACLQCLQSARLNSWCEGVLLGGNQAALKHQANTIPTVRPADAARCCGRCFSSRNWEAMQGIISMVQWILINTDPPWFSLNPASFNLSHRKWIFLFTFAPFWICVFIVIHPAPPPPLLDHFISMLQTFF